MLDSFGLAPQDNEVGGIYKVAAPRVNASFPPLSWQTYDIDFRAERRDINGQVISPAKVTILLNGVKIHDNLTIPGPTPGGNANFSPRGPLLLQDHNDAVRYRNIWVVEPQNVPLTPTASTRAPGNWRTLFDGGDIMANWGMANDGAWFVKDAALTMTPGKGDIWTKESFGDFEL